MHPRFPAPIALFCLTQSLLAWQTAGQVIVTPFSGTYVKTDEEFAALARAEYSGDFDGGGAEDDVRLVLPFAEKMNLAPQVTYTGPAFYGAYQVDAINAKSAATFKFQKVQSSSPSDRIVLAATPSGGDGATMAGFLMFDIERPPEPLRTLSIGGEKGESVMLEFRYLLRSGSSYLLSEETFSDLGRVNTTEIAKQGWSVYDPNPVISKGPGLRFEAESAKFTPLTDEGLRAVDRVGVFFQSRVFDDSTGALVALSSVSYSYDAAAVPEPEEYAFWTGLGLLGLAWYRRRSAS